jgi:hypothetical protein
MAYRDYLRAGNFGGDGVLGKTRGALGLASKGRPVRHARDFTAELLACRRRHDDQVDALTSGTCLGAVKPKNLGATRHGWPLRPLPRRLTSRHHCFYDLMYA